MSRKDYYHVPGAPKANSMVPAVSAVLRDQDGKFVLHRRTDNGLWSIPGGGIELGESVLDAIIREVREETGLVAKIERLVGIYSDPQHVIEFTNGEVRQEFSICFNAIVQGGELAVSSESHEVRVFGLAELSMLDIHPSIRKRIEDSLANVSEAFVR